VIGGQDKSWLAARTGHAPQPAIQPIHTITRAADQRQLHFKRIKNFSLKR
jgi:hypothetical protein